MSILRTDPFTNWLTITAVDAWSNSVTTNIAISKSALELTIDPIDGSQLYLPTIDLHGTVSDSSFAVTVNGMVATVDGTTWSVANVPVNAGGTASFAAAAAASGTSAGKMEANEDKQARLYVETDVQINHGLLHLNSTEYHPDGSVYRCFDTGLASIRWTGGECMRHRIWF